MHKSIITTLLIFAISFSGIIFGTGLALANSSPTDARVTATKLIADYHITANRITNEQVSRVLTFFDDLDVDTDGYTDRILETFSPPEFIDEVGVRIPTEEACESSLSTQCLNQRLFDEFLLLMSGLGLTYGNIEGGISFDSLGQVITSIEDQQSFLIDQLEVALQVTRQTVSFYDQILQAYPIHVQNQRIIEELEKLQVNLSQLRRTMEPYSNIFHNVTSAACE